MHRRTLWYPKRLSDYLEEGDEAANLICMSVLNCPELPNCSSVGFESLGSSLQLVREVGKAHAACSAVS